MGRPLQHLDTKNLTVSNHAAARWVQRFLMGRIPKEEIPPGVLIQAKRMILQTLADAPAQQPEYDPDHSKDARWRWRVDDLVFITNKDRTVVISFYPTKLVSRPIRHPFS